MVVRNAAQPVELDARQRGQQLTPPAPAIAGRCLPDVIDPTIGAGDEDIDSAIGVVADEWCAIAICTAGPPRDAHPLQPLLGEVCQT